MNILGQRLAKYLAEQRGEILRWTVCLTVVLLFHVAVGFALRQYAEAGFSENQDDLSVVMLDLPEAPQPPVEEKKEEPPPPQEEEKPPEPEPEVVMPTPEPPPPVEEKPVTPPPPQVPVRVVVTWQGRLAAHIERFRRFQERGDVGLARVGFTIDHEGHLLTSHIVQSSGSPSLDQEALAMVVRADPMPKPPEGTPDSALSMIVPVRFFVR